MNDGNARIRQTLDAYNIGLDAYTRPDPAHAEAVSKAISLLIDNGMIVEREYDELYDPDGDNALYEAHATGRCRQCLLVTKGGICEACGHPNDPADLLDDSGLPISVARHSRRKKQLVLPIENYREELTLFYRQKQGKWRPHLLKLVDELLSEPLADYPISHNSNWGIPIPHDDWDGHVINVWAEMGLGLVHALKRCRSAKKLQGRRYVQFLGYDNSYFFSVVHPVLQLALERLGHVDTLLPEFIFTNEFYNLEDRKFSTSQGHAIWGREFLDHVTSDEARFYLSLSGPELAESNFVLDAAIRDIEARLRQPFVQLLQKVDDLAKTQLTVSTTPEPVAARLEQRFAFFSEPENFSSRELAVISGNLLSFLATYPISGADVQARERFCKLVTTWVGFCRVFSPGLADQVEMRLKTVLATRTLETSA